MKVLIIKMSSLGDLFHALPAVHCLKTGLGASIDWVVQEEYVGLVKCFTDVDRVIGFPRRQFWAQRGDFLEELRGESYDFIIDLQGLLKSALVARRARGSKRIGPSFQREGARFLYDAVAAPRNKERHAVEECLDVVRYLGLPMLGPQFPVKFPVKEIAAARPRIAMLPCSRHAEKNWPYERFVEVGRELRLKRKATIYLIGSTADAPTCASIAAGLDGGFENLAGKTSFTELGSLLQEMDLLVTVDSGPMHMAAALGVPTVAVFGPTYPERTGPFGSKHRVIKQGDDLRVLPAEPVIRASLEMLKSS